jgi:UDP-perosamine 4-acetyltransferase
MDKLILIGAGGHGRVLLDILRDQKGKKVIGYCDLRAKEDVDCPYLGKDDEIAKKYPAGKVLLVNGIGSIKQPFQRRDIFLKFKALGYRFASIIHSAAVLSKRIRLGEGVQIMAGAIINVGASIGDNAIINTKASVDHDCTIGAHTHVAPGVTLSGGVRIGQTCLVGTGANVIQQITIEDEVLVGAGETIRHQVARGRIVWTRSVGEEVKR